MLVSLRRSFRKLDEFLEEVFARLLAHRRLAKLTIGLLVALSVVLAVAIRVAPYKMNEFEFLEFDSYIEYWQAKYVYEHGPLSWYTLTPENPDTHRFWYPWGRDFVHTSFPFLPMWTGVTYHLVKHFGLTLQQWAALQPVLFAAIATVVAYLAVKEVSSSRLAGVLGSFLYAVLPAAVERSVIGYVEKEGVAAVFIFLFVYFYSKSLKAVYTTKWGWLKYTTPAALSLALVGWLWGGYAYILGTVVLSLVLAPILLRERFTREVLLCNVVLVVLTMVFIVPSPATATTLGVYPLSLRGLGWVLLGATLLPAVYYFTHVEYKRVGFKRPLLTRGKYFLLLVAVAACGLVIVFTGVLPLGYRPLMTLGIRIAELGPLGESIAEHQSPLSSPSMFNNMLHSWGVYIAPLVFASPLFLGIIGIFYLLYRGRPEQLYLAIAFALSFYSYLNMVYMIGVAAYFGIVVIAVMMSAIMLVAFPYTPQRPLEKKSVRARGRLKGSWYTRAVALLFLVAVYVNIGYTAYTELQVNSRILYTFRAGVSNLNYYSDSWYRAVETMRSMPNDSVIIAWWDYGYGISVSGEKISVADGSTLNGTQIGIIGLIMWSDSTDKAANLAKLFRVKPNSTYLMVIEGFIAVEQNETVLIWPVFLGGGIPGIVDWPKSLWMLKIGNFEVNNIRRLTGLEVEPVDSANYLYFYYNQYTGEYYVSPPLTQPEKTPLVYKLVVDAALYWAESKGKRGVFYWFTGSEQTLSSSLQQQLKSMLGVNITKQVSITNITGLSERPLKNDPVLEPYAVIVEPFTSPDTGAPLTATVMGQSGVVYSVIAIYRFTNIPSY